MLQYALVTEELCSEEIVDPISYEQLKYRDKDDHPRHVILVRRSNGVPYPYKVTTIIKLIEHGGIDPFTRKPFHPLICERANLFKKAVDEFPTLKITADYLVQLYHEWIDEYILNTIPVTNNTPTMLQARSILQVKDICHMFFPLSGPGSLMNRATAEQMLSMSEKGTWLLRNSSIRGSKYTHIYVLSYVKKKHRVKHILIMHQIGLGFFYNIITPRNVTITNLPSTVKDSAVCIVDIIHKFVIRGEITIPYRYHK